MGEATTTIAGAEAEVQEKGQHEDTITEAIRNDDLIETLDEVGEGNEAIITADAPAIMELAYHVTGERRKELVKAISKFTGMEATY